jgi:hypothetical protein
MSKDLEKYIEERNSQNHPLAALLKERPNIKDVITFEELAEGDAVTIFNIRGTNVWHETLPITSVHSHHDTIALIVEDNGKQQEWTALRTDFYIIGYNFVCCPDCEANKRIVYDLMYFGVHAFRDKVSHAYKSLTSLLE